MKTEVLSVRVRKNLKKEADKMGIDVKKTLEAVLEEMVTAKKARALSVAAELGRLMKVTTEEWVDEVKRIREEE